ncbi:MAG TPA: hypothetical protein VES40_02195, partial [Ilumatobacteraceae bacterium]|nr:hypothetical protein [Ilumatobacteraceae bacterium]
MNPIASIRATDTVRSRRRRTGLVAVVAAMTVAGMSAQAQAVDEPTDTTTTAAPTSDTSIPVTTTTEPNPPTVETTTT